MSSALFELLPTTMENLILSFRMDQVLFNRTKGEYIEYTTSKLKKLLNKVPQKQVIISRKIGEKPTFRVVAIGQRPWNKDDLIISVPMHLELYVKQHYIKIDI